jgi:4-diphosphocytidyl-2-C-methyl-D-erythritol kinase
LFLLVTGQRRDGYHDIQTLFQLIDLFDELHIEVTGSARIVRPAGASGVSEKEDLVVRAAKLLQAETGSRQGARISVHKRIPLGAGLGGGSSDAATTLLALNDLWRCKLDLDDLAALGLRLGADIPVFIHGRTALASGIGEQLEKVELGPRHYVLVFNPQHISTEQIFNHPRLVRDSSPLSLQDVLAGTGRNDCEAVVRKLYPELENVMKELEDWGKPRMTGTGSCVFLTMPDEQTAISTAHEINCRYNVRAVRGLDRSPVHDMLIRRNQHI